MPAKKVRKRATRSNANQAEAEISTNQMFRCLLSVLARRAIPEATVRAAVGKQIKAYNLLDGTRTLAEVGEAAHKDRGQMSRTVARWVEEGVAFRLGNGKGARLLHVYPITERATADGE